MFNILVFIGTITSCFSSYINPENFWPASLVAITFPVWMSVNLFFIVYWLAAKIEYSLISILAVLFCINSTQSLIQFNLGDSAGANGISIVSYNAGGYGNKSKLTWYKRIGALEKMIKKHDADIYCLQENVDPLFELKGHEDDGYEAHRFAENHGTSIYSKSPMIRKGKIDFGLITNSGVWADIKINGDTIRVYSIHLKSNRINIEELEDLNELNRDFNKNVEDTKGVLGKYGKKSAIRAQQIDLVLKHVSQSPHPVIVCGDFNEPPPSYVYKQISRKLKDSFLEKGFGVDGTFAGKLPYLRIDYVFADPTLEILSYETISSTRSDHFPVRVVVE